MGGKQERKSLEMLQKVAWLAFEARRLSDSFGLTRRLICLPDHSGFVRTRRRYSRKRGHKLDLVTASLAVPPDAFNPRIARAELAPLSCWSTGIVWKALKAFHFGKNPALAALAIETMARDRSQYNSKESTNANEIGHSALTGNGWQILGKKPPNETRRHQQKNALLTSF